MSIVYSLHCPKEGYTSTTVVHGQDLELLFKYTNPAVAAAAKAFHEGPAGDLFRLTSWMESAEIETEDEFALFVIEHGTHARLQVRDEYGHVYDDEGGAL